MPKHTRTPRNTANAMQDPAERLLFLAESMGSRGPGGFIEAQEAAGQREIVHSDVLPTKTNSCTDADLTALGFDLGDKVDGDPMFRYAKLPDGWSREGSEHAMWSYLLDTLGRRRCSIFYKAAFYDRDAFISVATVRSYVYDRFYDKKRIVLDDEWATKDAVLTAIDELIAEETERVGFWTEHGRDEYASEHQEKAEGFRTLRTSIEEAH